MAKRFSRKVSDATRFTDETKEKISKALTEYWHKILPLN